MKSSKFYKGAKLMMDCLPVVNQYEDFALKGGTAINFFIRNMPRLSVDIDLTYLPIIDRTMTLQNISDLLGQMSDSIEGNIAGTRVTKISPKEEKRINKLSVIRDEVRIKIEPNEILRGSVFKPRTVTTCEAVQDVFETEVEMKILSLPDLYGGKLCAAFDRQHPRDIFDVKLLLENEGITDEIKLSFLAYLLSHDRPINEVLSPSRKNITDVFKNDFEGMTNDTISMEKLNKVRENMISCLHEKLTDQDRKFLLSFKNGKPIWNLFPIEIGNLPSIRWKLMNIQKLKSKNPQKHALLYAELKRKLES